MSTTVRRQGYQPGQLVWANVFNFREDPNSLGKLRPVVLITCEGSYWHVMGLTTQSCYAKSGERRVPIPDFANVGLTKPGYLWGGNLTRVRTVDLGGHIGWVDVPLARAIDLVVGLYRSAYQALVESAHRTKPVAA